MLNGIVYRDGKDTTLLYFSGEWQSSVISDFDYLYADLPLNKADIVRVTFLGNNVLSLESIDGMSFNNSGVDCSAAEAIKFSLHHDPEKLLDLIRGDSVKSEPCKGLDLN